MVLASQSKTTSKATIGIVFCLLVLAPASSPAVLMPCVPKRHHPDLVYCPTKSCRQHIDCWVSYGTPQSCVCDPHLCGPICLPENARCPVPKSPIGGSVAYNSTGVGDVVRYKCEPGLVVRGPRSRHCLATLKWSGAEPVCSNETNSCFSAPYIPNTYVIDLSSKTVGEKQDQRPSSTDTRDDYQSGQVIQVKCLPGYQDTAVASIRATCVGSEWHFNLINCQRISCSQPLGIADGKLVQKAGIKYQDELVMICSDGYAPDCRPSSAVTTDGKGCTSICHADGTWSTAFLACKPITCPPLDAPANGGVSTYSTLVNSTARFHCNPGYELIGSSYHHCLPNGRWDGQSVVCKEQDCGKPPKIPHAMLSYDSTTFGSKLLIKCDADTTPSVDISEWYCDERRNETKWTPEPFPTCNQHCYLFTIDHGEVHLVYTTLEGVRRSILITVDTYDQYSSHQTSRLNANVDPKGLILPGERVRHGSILNVTCHHGYWLAKRDQSMPVCHNGVWSVRSKCQPGKLPWPYPNC